MKIDRLAVLFPFYSIIPAGLGWFAVWILFTIFNLFGFINCPTWDVVSVAPVNTIQIASYTNDVLFIQTQDGKLYCNKTSQWEICSLPTYPSTSVHAPTWLMHYAHPILQKQTSVKLLVRINEYDERKYFAIASNNEIWQCSSTVMAELNQLVFSWKVFLLSIPLALGIFSIWWFFKILITEGRSVIWDWRGRGKEIK